MRSVEVSFPGDYGRRYEYFISNDDEIALHGHCVVDVAGTFKCVRVERVLEEATAKATKWIVGVVDTTKYKAREAAAKKAASLKKELEKRYKAYEKSQEDRKYDILASQDSQVAAMLRELRSIEA